MSENNQPRKEAGVIPAKALTDDQRRALQRIIGYLNHIAALPTPPQYTDIWARFVPKVDRERRNHVFLIDGERGSGKSALLLTLLHILGQTLRDDTPPPEYELTIAVPPIVPVGLIDLQPLDQSTNLLLHLVGQLGRLAEVLEQELPPGKTTTAANLWAETREHDSVRARRELTRVATAAWDGGLGMRTRDLSLEERAVELDHAERRRLDLDHAFRHFVDALTQDYSEWQTRQKRGDSNFEPLFIIAIDDADMNPDRSRELLDLVRTLWHPRVAYVLTGHKNLFLDIIERDLIIEPKRISLSQLARNIYDKIIPGPHHLDLPPLSWPDRIHALRQALTADLPDKPALPDSINTLLGLFVEDNQSAEAIPERLREIQDLAQMLRATTGSVAELVHCFLRQAELGNTIPYQYQLEGDKDRKRLYIYAQLQSWFLEWHRYTKIPAKPGINIEVHIEILTTPKLRIAGNRNKPTKADPLRRAAGLILLAAASEQHDIHVYTGPIEDTCWVRTRLEELEFPWPLPAWQRIELLALVTRRWVESTRQPVPENVEPAAWLAAVYLSCVLHTDKDDPVSVADEDLSKELKDLIDEQGNIQWQELAVRVARVAQPDKPALSNWARAQAALLAAPESGLSDNNANLWIEAFHKTFSKTFRWDAIASEIREARRLRMSRSGTGSSRKPDQAIFHRLDRKYPLHQFAQLVNEHIEIIEPLRAALYNLEFPPIPGIKTNKQPQHPDVLLQGTRRRHLAMAPLELQTAMAEALNNRGLRGLTQKSLYDLWLTVAKRHRNSIDPNFIRLEGASFAMQPDSFAMQPDVWHDTDGDVLSLSLEDNVEIRILRAQYPIIKNLRIDLPHELYAVIRLIYDFMVDTSDMKGSNNSSQLTVGWKYLCIRDRDGERHLPAPNWEGSLDWEILCDAWNDSFEALSRTDTQGNTFLEHKIYDSIVHWYFESIISLYNHRKASRLEYKEVKPSSWSRIGSIVTREAVALEEATEERVAVLAAEAEDAQGEGDEDTAATGRGQLDELNEAPYSLIKSRRRQVFLAWVQKINTDLIEREQAYHLTKTAYQELRQGSFDVLVSKKSEQ